MASIISPNMSLVIPGVGTESGPLYASDVNASLNIIDQHDHSSGSGVPITPNGININAALTFQNNLASSLAGVNLTAQGSAPGNNTIYESGNDLHFVNGAGLDIQITNGSGVAGSPGSIANLVAPASASYVSANQTFVWQSNTSIAANMDFGSAVMRNLSPNSTFALTLSPPAALGSNYSITLPSLPASQKIMTLDNSGNMSAPYTVDGSTITISANVIGVPNQGIPNAKIADDTITNAKINSAAGIVGTKLANNTITTSQISLTAGITSGQLAAAATATSSSSGSVSTTSASFVTVPNLAITITEVANRPIFLTFTGSGTIEPNYGTGSIQVEAGTLGRYRVRLNGTTTAYEYAISEGSATASNGMPAGALNGIIMPTGTGLLTIELEYAAVGGGTNRVVNVVMKAYQI